MNDLDATQPLEESKTLWPIEKLFHWSNNPRSITTEDKERLQQQINDLGEYKPLVITQEGEVIGGNQRLDRYIEMGKKEAWVSIVNAETDAEKLKYALSDNDHAGKYEEQQLAKLIEELGVDINLEEYKVDLGDPITLAQLLENLQDDSEIKEDEAPPVSQDPAISQLGEVYQLGRHRLMCGDSVKIDDINKLLNSVQPTMVFTDPPYGVDYQSRVDEERRKGWGGIKNDELKGAELQQFLKDSVGIYGQAKYICCNWQSVVDFWQALGKPNSLIVWDKGSIGLGAGYRNQHEIILFYGKLNHNSETNVWSIKRDSAIAYTHPTQKPVAIPARAIKNSSNNGDVVLDVFGGSGSTLIACEQTNRQCFMMELDPKYCDVIRKRYAKFIDKEDSWQTETPVV